MLTFGDIIILLIVAGFIFLLYKLWQERNNKPRPPKRGSKLTLIIVLIVFFAVGIGMFILAIKHMLNPLELSISESYRAKKLGKIHNWVWSLAFLGMSVLINYLNYILIKTWKYWKTESIIKGKNEKETKESKDTDKFKESDHSKFMPK